MIAGPNGAGKSTLVSRHFIGHVPLVNPDDIAAAIREQSGQITDARILAGRMAVRRREALLSEAESFAVETTLTGNSELDLMRRAGARAYKINLFYVGVDDVGLSEARVALRVRSGGHDVPIDDIMRRFGRTFANLAVALPLADRAWVLDNSGERRRLLLVRDSGRVKYCSRDLPVWALGAIPAALRQRGLSSSA